MSVNPVGCSLTADVGLHGGIFEVKHARDFGRSILDSCDEKQL